MGEASVDVPAGSLGGQRCRLVVEMIVVTATMKDAPKQWLDDMEASGISRDNLGWHKNWPNNIGLVAAYQKLYEDCKAQDIIAYSHDDVTVHESGWNERVLREFEDPKIAIVGMGGSKGIGDARIYKVPYRLEQLARVDYLSNQVDAEIHGRRFTGETDVAVLDGFFMAIRTSFLDKIGGFKWIEEGTNFHNWDNAMCLEAWRRGYRVRMCGISVLHHGGQTSTSAEYVQWCRDRGTTVEAEHREPHRWLYERYRDILPLRVA